MRGKRTQGLRTVLPAVALLIALISAAAMAAPAGDRVAILLDSDSIPQMTEAWRAIEKIGGRVEHIFPPQVIIGSLDPALEPRVWEIPNVAQIFRGQAPGADRFGEDYRTSIGLQAFDRVFGTGRALELQPFDATHLGEDALLRPPISEMSGEAPFGNPPGFYETSEFMGGAVVVGMILPESNGVSGPDDEDWTTEEVTHVVMEVMAGLNYYTEINEQADLTWIYHFANAPPADGVPGTVECDYEAIQNHIFSSTVAYSFFSYLGYPTGSMFERCYQFNNDVRAAYGADWAFVVKCADDTSGAYTHYSSGHIAAAYVPGPTTAMSYTNGSYGPEMMDGVLRHETIHIFGAMDEYMTFTGCPYNNYPGYFWGYLGVANANSQCDDGTGYNGGEGERQHCIGWNVRTHMNVFCPYTRGQIGWLDDDADGLPNPMDTYPESLLGAPVISGGQATFTGSAEASALLPEVSHGYDHTVPVTINTIRKVQYRIDGRTWLEATATDGAFDDWQEGFTFTTPPMPNGTYEIEVRAVNDRDNAEASLTRTMLEITDSGVLNTAPLALLRMTPEVGSTATYFRFDATACGDLEDDTKLLSVRWDFDNDGTFDTAYSTRKVVYRAYPTPGFNSIRMEVKDSSGASVVVSKLVLVSAGDLPPEAVFSVNREDMHGQEFPGFVFDCSATHDAETPDDQLEFRWDWENDGEWDTDYSTARVYSHTYGSLGAPPNHVHSDEWIVRMEVRDQSFNTASTTHNVWANGYNHPPVAQFSADQTTGTTGTVFHFDAAASFDPDQGEAWDNYFQYRWDVDGDGTFETDFEASHGTAEAGFDSIGVYPVTLEVRDRYHALSRFVLPVAVSDDGLNTPPVPDFRIRSLSIDPIKEMHMAEDGASSRASSKIFYVNAAACTDAEDAAVDLQVRWDWENDGTWDTQFTTTKFATHTYPDTTNPTIAMEVRDTGGLGGTLARTYRDLEAPAPPVGLAVDPGPGLVQLSWFPNEEPDLAGYRVYRRLASEHEFGPPMADVGPVAGYTDYDVVEQETYVYAITAYDRRQNESTYSDPVELTIPDLTPPMVPENLARAVGDGVVHLRWEFNSSEDIFAFVQYRREVGQADWVYINFTYDEYLIDNSAENGVDYEYTVTAVDRANNESDYAVPVQATPRPADSDPPALPAGVDAVAAGTGIEVSWDQSPDDDVYYWYLLRRESGGTEYEYAGFCFFNQTAILDEAVTPGVTYCYVVEAWDTSNNGSGPSVEVCATAP